MKVVATINSKKYHVPIREVGRIVESGEVFELNERAFNRLNGNGPSRIKFVEEYMEKVEQVEVVEKPKKKRKKKVNEGQSA